MSLIKIKTGGFYYKFYNTLSLSLVQYSLGWAVNVQESSVDGQQARADSLCFAPACLEHVCRHMDVNVIVMHI